MRILLDCRPIQAAGSNSEKNRLILSAVASLSTEKAVEWLFLVDHNYQPGALADLPGTPADQPHTLPDLPGAQVILARSLPGTLGWKLWYDWQLPRLAKRHKADLLILTGGVTAKPSGIPQCVWMPAGDAPIYMSRLDNTVRHAETIFCFSEKDKTSLAARGAIDAENIHVVRPAPSPEIHPLGIGDKEAIKQQYTGGKEYFFIPAAGVGEDDIVQLLKAFSLFKKRQLSNLQLVIAGTQSETLRQLLETYRYRADIHWVDATAGHDTPATTDATASATATSPGQPTAPTASAAAIMAAAYAVIFAFENGSLGTSLLNAWKARIPALVARNTRLHEMADDTASIPGIDDPAALAAHMMAIYKDETKRNALIETGTSRLAIFDPSPSLAAIRSIIGREINKIK